MKKLTYLLLIGFSIFSCTKKEAKKKEVLPNEMVEEEIAIPTTKKEITDPKETEIWEPEPKVVSFTKNNTPSDAIVLFDGSNLDLWITAKDSTDASWTLQSDDSMTVKPGAGDIQTKQNFGSIQLHLEWSAPNLVRGKGQERGNSGIFFQNRYEVQILDSYQNRTYANGQATAIYKQHIPLVNATKATDQWQTYDIIFHAPVFDPEGKKVKSGSFTVLHNGVLVQDNVEILGTTEYIGFPKNEAHEKGPIKLQDHGNPVQYRNIWVRELD
ncbi:DUF1080 domain-containing protein [Aquimarina sp. RZ0]|uniref:3-keto-disaccharide hydrolase n=1 Tax=Aquimarina sp. RZ0 TaxID=2607730 RepID=UPI0011F39B3C|nr:DUF1080 domain-containing protein [Aquimarina sp. RZ0]KAA1244026.1 DUF1080 domain-containing protein [Aquimarina sp. RZ0]